jgi:CheY-like chemotaxis protein
MSKPLAVLYYSNLMPGGQLANRLQDMGYRVQTLPELARLTEVCQAAKPLVVVAEILPDGPAFEAVGQLRKDPATQHIPVLGYTASQDAAHHHRAKIAGVSLLAGHAAISEHLPQLLDQVLQVE